MNRRLSSIFFIILAIAGLAAIVIAYGRGYRPNIKDGTLKATGMLVVTSSPDGAQVFINGKLKTATNNTLNLAPDRYEIEIKKDGYFTWKKNLKIQGEIVTKADALLLPKTPSLKALTSTGALNPTLSPSGNRIVYGSGEASLEKKGVYILDLIERPILGANNRQIAKDTAYLLLSQANYLWSPDGKEIIAYFKNNDQISSVYLLEPDKLNEVPRDISLTYQTTLLTWEKEQQLIDKQKIQSLKKKALRVIVKDWEILSWSPDDAKILYAATTSAKLAQIIKPALIGTNSQKETRNLEIGKVYVYDSKEDKNFLIGDLDNLIPDFPLETFPDYPFAKTVNAPLLWFPNSGHLILSEKDKISISEYDGYNTTPIYAGPYTDHFVFPWPDGSRLVILTNYNPSSGVEANLYAISLR